jgi:mRNA-degrading endonuclease toxin of MazEF toxin-antitoxin module
LPLVSITRVISVCRTIHAEESGQAVNSEFACEQIESVPLELFIGEDVGRASSELLLYPR